MKKRILSILLVIVMVVSLMPTMALAAASDVTVTSEVTENKNETKLTFTYDEGSYEYCLSYSDIYVENYGYDPAYVAYEYCKWYSVPASGGTVPCNVYDDGDYYSTVWIREAGETDYTKCVKAVDPIQCKREIEYVSFDLLPMAGQVPPTSCQDVNEQCSASLAWSDAQGQPVTQFVYGEMYQVVATLLLPENSVFSEDDFEAELSDGTDGTGFDPVAGTVKFEVYCASRESNIMRGIMRRSTFDVNGLFDGKWKKTTYDDGGFETYMIVGTLNEGDGGGEKSPDDAVHVSTPLSFTSEGISVSVGYDFMNEGQTVQVSYTVTNNSEDAKVFSIGSGADIQIGASDGAVITEFSDGSGFKMVSTSDSDKNSSGEYAQLNFWCQNTKGVDPVDHFWYGAWSSSYNSKYVGLQTKDLYWDGRAKNAVFCGSPTNRLSADDPDYDSNYLDSAMAWSWTNKKIAAGETQTYSVLFGIGGPGSENVASGEFDNIVSKQCTIVYDGNLSNLAIKNIEVIPYRHEDQAFALVKDEQYKVGTYQGKPAIQFLEAAGLAPRWAVNVTVSGDIEGGGQEDGKVIPVRNNITANGPECIRFLDVELDDYNKYLDAEGSPTNNPAEAVMVYDSAEGKLTLNGLNGEGTETGIEIPASGEGHAVTLEINGTNKIQVNDEVDAIDSGAPLCFSGEGTLEVSGNTDGAKANISAPGIEITSGTLNVSGTIKTIDFTSNGGSVTADEIDADGDVEVNQGGNVTANKIDADGDVVIGGNVTIDAKNANALSGAALKMKDGGTLTINLNGQTDVLDLDDFSDFSNYEITGGKINTDGTFTADEGATQIIIRKKAAPAPSGGGSSSAPTITVPVTGDENTVKVQASVSGSTATVKDIKDADLKKVSGGETVEIDLSGLNKNIDTAKIPTTTVEKIAEQGGMSVKLSTATVTFDAAATQTITEQAKGNTIELVVDDIKTVSLNAVQKEAVQKLDAALIIDAYLVSNGTRLCSESKGGFGGGKATVALPYEIKGNRTAANYSVYYVDDAGKLEKLNASYDADAKAFVFDIEHFSNYVVAYDENAMPFADVPAGKYYYDAVKWALENGITEGKKTTLFDPSGSVTRAQVVTFLWRAAGKPVVNYAMNMSDVASGKYYTEAVRWALAEGITKGTDAAHFSPNATCTRGQIVSFLYRYAKAAASETSNPFTDVKAGAYYYDAVLWAVENGITGGKTAMTFVPKEPCTRAQVVTFLYRYMGK